MPLYALSFVLLAAAIAGFIWHDLRDAYRDTVGFWRVRMSNSADEQVSVATLWLKERRTDAAAVAGNTVTTRLLSMKTNSSHFTEVRHSVDQVIERIARVNGFLGAAVADTECRIVLQREVPAQAIPAVQEACLEAQRGGDLAITASVIQPARVLLNLGFPVFAPEEGRALGHARLGVLGAVIMVAEPWESVFHLASSQSETEKTTETLLVWQNAGEAVVFLPRLGAQGMESVFRRPLSAATLESWVAREGNVRFGEFLDHRGVSVFGTARPIEKASASLVRKVDRDAALADFRERSRMEWLAGTLSVLLIGSVIAVQHRRATMRDLQDKLIQEQTLRESELRYRILFESAGDAIFLMQGETFIDCNRRALEMFRCSRSHLIGKTPFTYSPPRQRDGSDSRQAAREKVRQALDGETLHFEWQHCRLDGTPFDAEVVLNRLVTQGETLLLGLVRDITERRQMENALRESDQRYKDFISHSNEGVWRIEMAPPIPAGLPENETVERVLRHGCIAECNLALARILGYSTTEEVVGKRLQDVIPSADSDKERVESLLSAARGGWVTRNTEFRGVDQQGNIKYLLRTEIPIVENGMLVRVWGITRDVTALKQADEARKESEERFRNLSNASLEGIMIHHQGVVLDANPAFARLFGYEQPEDLIGKEALRLLLTPSSQASIRHRMTEHETGLIEVTGVRRDGTTFAAETDSRPVKYLGQDARIVSCRDVTERKVAQEELHHSFEQLHALAARLQNIREEERTRVAREIHDQLGQALSAIKIGLTSLVRGLPADQTHPLKKTSSILQLVDEMIQTVRRISTELRPGILDDLGLVAAVEWAGEEFEARTGTKCRFALPTDDFAVDPERATAVFRIFQETLTNVARHADASEIRVRLAMEGKDLTLEVHDNGRGISEERLSNRRSLGILGMRERAMLLGGELTITGAPGKGTTVRVRVPEAGRQRLAGERDDQGSDC